MSNFLNTPRGRLSVALLIITGMISLTLGTFFPNALWTFPVTILLVLTFVIGTVLIYTPEGGRLRTLVISAPAIGAVILGLTVLPQFVLALSGAGVGWIVAGFLLFRKQTPREVMQAIRQMRKGNYEQALEAIDVMIKRDKDDPEHYRLRAMIFRLDGRLDRAKRDYDTILKLAGNGANGDAVRAEAYDGLSEVHLQAGRFEHALEAALAAHRLFPENWVPLYNLGLINDRLKDADAAIGYLNQALVKRIPDVRQRLLAHFYLVRAYARLKNHDEANAHLELMKTLWSGLEGLEKLLSDEQSAPLSAVLADDVATARALMTGDMRVSGLL